MYGYPDLIWLWNRQKFSVTKFYAVWVDQAFYAFNKTAYGRYSCSRFFNMQGSVFRDEIRNDTTVIIALFPYLAMYWRQDEHTEIRQASVCHSFQTFQTDSGVIHDLLTWRYSSVFRHEKNVYYGIILLHWITVLRMIRQNIVSTHFDLSCAGFGICCPIMIQALCPQAYQ